jgi:polysaccharide chain length determinant protein (PEP-CTERM system associated)
LEPFEITKYKDIAFRRKWWIIISFLLTLLAGLTYVLMAPKIYEAQTLILVQPQRVPEDFVRSIVPDTVEGRLRTITQQVTSRTNLEKIIREHQLYSSPDNGMLMDSKVLLLRQNININVSHSRSRDRDTNAFTITFRGKEPKKVMKVTNALASNFIEENIRTRESQARGTSEFLSDELESVRKRLIKSEEDLKKYRENYMGGLPEQLQTNLSIMERLQGHLDQINSSLREAENRRITIQTQIAEQERERGRRQAAGQPPVQDEEGNGITALKNELASLETRYTENHPDVIRLKKRIAQLEAERVDSSVQTTSSVDKPADLPEADQALRRQLQEVALEIKGYKAEINKTRSQIAWYEKKVEETPKREQELLSLERDYENLKELYNSILSRKLEAEIAVSMEKKQKGEQFRIIDEAIIPMRPVEPDMKKILLLTLALGFGLGCGLAYLKEMMDTSFKTPEDVEEEFQLPVLVSMPIRYTAREEKSIKRKKVLAAVCVGFGFFLSAIGIVFAVKGIDTTLSYVKELISGL